MCKAEREMKEKARQEGSEKARLETLCSDVRNVMDSFKVSLEDAMSALKIGKKDQEILMKMI